MVTRGPDRLTYVRWTRPPPGRPKRVAFDIEKNAITRSVQDPLQLFRAPVSPIWPERTCREDLAEECRMIGVEAKTELFLDGADLVRS
jgi:hypothetical protein